MGGLASGGCDRPVRKRRRLHACPAGTEGPRRPSSLPTVRTDPMPGPPEERLHAGPRRAQRSAPARTGPTPALLPDDPAPPVRGTTPDARHSNTLPAPTTHRPEPSVRHPTAAPPEMPHIRFRDRRPTLHRSPFPENSLRPTIGRPSAQAAPAPILPPAPHRPEHIPPPGMRRGPIFARYSPNVLPSDK